MNDQVFDAWDKVVCPKCKGKGSLLRFRYKMNGGKCFTCYGSGYIDKEKYNRITSVDPEEERRKTRYRIDAMPVFYNDDPRIKERGMHPFFAVENLMKEDGITKDHADDVIEHLMKHYKQDPRSQEAKFGGFMYARESFKLAKEDGILRDLLIPSETPEIEQEQELSATTPEVENSFESALLLDDDEVLL